MKPQDIGFILVLFIAIIVKKSRISISLGILFLFLAIPLFAKWVFFTAERLVWYGAVFFLLGITQILWEAKSENRN